jgi:predicted Zn-ribbon and HTH transcriptional regulator
MRLEPVRDPEGDIIAEREQADRALERADAPELHLDVHPIEPCRECGYPVRELWMGEWRCPCDAWSQVA